MAERERGVLWKWKERNVRARTEVELLMFHVQRPEIGIQSSCKIVC